MSFLFHLYTSPSTLSLVRAFRDVSGGWQEMRAFASIEDGSSVTEHVRRDTLIFLSSARDNTRPCIEDTSITRDAETPPWIFIFSLSRAGFSGRRRLSGNITRDFFTSGETLMAATVSDRDEKERERSTTLMCRPTIHPRRKSVSAMRYVSLGVGAVVRREWRRACAEFMQMYAGNILNK